MKMKPQHRQGGYSNKTAQDYVDLQTPIYLLSNELETQKKFVDGKPTNEIIGYKAWFVQKGLDPFQVKFNDKIELPDFMALVQFDNLQACEVRYNVYFKADGIKEVN